MGSTGQVVEGFAVEPRVVAGLSVLDQGAGRPLVLVHGWHADAETNWAEAIEALGGWRVIAPDLPAHGRSPAPEQFSIGGCARAVAAVCDELDLRDVVVAGYSMGGPVAQALTRARPDLVGGLVMIATAARLLPTRHRRGPIPAVVQGTRLIAEAGTTIASVLVHERELRGHVMGLLLHPDAALVQAGWELARWDARGWVVGLDVPAASVITARDRAVPPAAQRELADLLAVPDERRFDVADGHLFCLRPGFGEHVARAARSLT